MRMLATQSVTAPHDHIGGGDSPDVECLKMLEVLTPPPARPPFPQARWQALAGDNPTYDAPDHKPYDTVPPASLPLPGELPSTCNPSPMNIENYRAVTVNLSSRLPLAFAWLVGDGELAMGLARNAHG